MYGVCTVFEIQVTSTLVVYMYSTVIFASVERSVERITKFLLLNIQSHIDLLHPLNRRKLANDNMAWTHDMPLT